jgi:hypothetical protein
MVSVPAPGDRKSVALYWSPKAWRPMTIGLVQPGTRRGTFLQMIGSRKTTPPRMLRMVPFGRLPHLLELELLRRGPRPGVIVAHFTATPCFFVALAESIVTWSFVASRCSMPRS